MKPTPFATLQIFFFFFFRLIIIVWGRRQRGEEKEEDVTTPGMELLGKMSLTCPLFEPQNCALHTVACPPPSCRPLCPVSTAGMGGGRRRRRREERPTISVYISPTTPLLIAFHSRTPSGQKSIICLTASTQTEKRRRRFVHMDTRQVFFLLLPFPPVWSP